MQKKIDFKDQDWLKSHIFDILKFYYPICIDKENGGYYSCYYDDGDLCPDPQKNLVGTCRFIYNFSIGYILSGKSWCRDAALHGLDFLQNHFLDRKNGGYYWILEGTKVKDSRKYTYGHAFALLAATKALEAGFDFAKPIINNIYLTMEDYLFQSDYGLYIDGLTEDWKQLSTYRGQNGNMHMCEALISAYEVTQEEKYLSRALLLAKNVTLQLTSQTGDMIWENYHSNWTVDWNYNKFNTKNDEIRPFGFIAGHSIEWSKLLVMLERYAPEPWILPKAEQLYRLGMSKGWDNAFSGLYYSLYQNQPIDTDKYYWVQTEAIGASALLAVRTGNKQYWANYEVVFNYAWNFFVDHEFGGWFATLSRDNKKLSNIKSSVSKADYHPIENCFETIRALRLFPIKNALS
ncbi:AGE family epimerase/isomerase [Terrilactibacillus laevilacticus]|uniref:AGE family epimerase/isomerase n=1 Tax=Terrilactibacillus laevilacticus TaxID=1380157 RepID=A0ABW5PPC3_9BACI|nr:AGE family epimerase/isomerase [Terrilactibacillus laevilacticus]